MPVRPLLRARPHAAVPHRRRGDGVDVWQIGLDVTGPQLDAAAALLTADELARAERCAPVVRRRSIAMRAALRSVLGRELGCSPADVPLATTAHGRPHLDLAAPTWDVNCSGSEDLGLIAVTRGARVGIDVERVVPWTAATADEGWLSATEVAALQALPPTERAWAATHSWTRKEAVLKALGSGLSLPPADIPTSPGGAPVTRWAGWSLVPVVVPPGFTATIACSARIATRNPILPRPLRHDGTTP